MYVNILFNFLTTYSECYLQAFLWNYGDICAP